jgi:hypothetical protein
MQILDRSTLVLSRIRFSPQRLRAGGKEILWN